MKEVNLKLGGYDTLVKNDKIIIQIEDEKNIEIPKDQVYMLCKILEKMK